MLHAVIMAGGRGTRFWPLSRQTFPKQFLTLQGGRSLLQSTFDRCRPDLDPQRVWIVTNALQAETTRRQLPEIPPNRILVEPCGRNTAACIGLAAIHLLDQDPEAVMAIMPADHVIAPPEAFRRSLSRAVRLVEQDPGRLVLFGVKPTSPATGFGYIECGPPLPDEPEAFSVSAFREKPDAATAEQYVQAGRFRWNCGIFVWRAATILDALARYEPGIHIRLLTLSEHIGRPDWEAVLAEQFPRMPSISIDYSVLERNENLCLLEASFDWDDVGNWEALRRLHGTDSDGNTVIGPHFGIATSGCTVRSEDGHLVATAGVKDLIVVHTPDATLVTSRRDENAVRELVNRLAEAGYEKHL